MLGGDTMEVLKKDENGTLVLRCTCGYSFVAFIYNDERPICPICGVMFKNLMYEIERAIDAEVKKPLRFFKAKLHMSGITTDMAIYGRSVREACNNLAVMLEDDNCEGLKLTECSRKDFLDISTKNLLKTTNAASFLENLFDNTEP